MTELEDKKNKQGTPEKDTAAEKELTILQPGAVPKESALSGFRHVSAHRRLDQQL